MSDRGVQEYERGSGARDRSDQKEGEIERVRREKAERRTGRVRQLEREKKEKGAGGGE